MALAKRGFYPESREQFEAALRVDPGSAVLHTDFGIMLASAGSADAAEEQYRRALQLDSPSITARFNLGVLLEDKRRDQEAIPLFRAILVSDAQHHETHLHLASALLRQGDRNQAIQHLRQAATSPNPAIRDAADDLLRIARTR